MCSEIIHSFFLKSIYIGWQFTGLLYCVDSKNNEAPNVLVDKNLVHDIAPQRGGGNESIEENDSKRRSFLKSL